MRSAEADAASSRAQVKPAARVSVRSACAAAEEELRALCIVLFSAENHIAPKTALGDGSTRRATRPRNMEMLEAVYQQIPTPVLLAFVIFIAHIIVITDTGAGVPIFFPIFKRCMRPFKPTVAYERLKSKYLIS